MQRSLFRIIDANFNRAREAARVMEEFCRFALNSASLSGRVKQLRHELSATVAKIDAELLIASRNAADDVGCDLKIENQLSRTNLRDCFTAAAKRLTEALRALSETTQILDPSIARTFEQLRFTAYTLEKDILIFSSTAEKLTPVRLYVLITARQESSDTEILDLAKACIAGGADCIQLRPKAISDDRILALACRLTACCKDARIVSIINDRVDIAALAGADGVHLGQSDLPLKQARRMQLTPMIFGQSTHSIDQLKSAIEQDADYVALGPVFTTPTKPNANPVGLQYITDAVKLLNDTGIAHVAIGGITAENIDRVLKAGAKTVAVCSAVTQADSPEQACRTLRDKIVSQS